MHVCNAAAMPTLRCLVVPTWVPELVVHKSIECEVLHEEGQPGVRVLWLVLLLHCRDS